jgi:hypothetical protein
MPASLARLVTTRLPLELRIALAAHKENTAVLVNKTATNALVVMEEHPVLTPINESTPPSLALLVDLVTIAHQALTSVRLALLALKVIHPLPFPRAPLLPLLAEIVCLAISLPVVQRLALAALWVSGAVMPKWMLATYAPMAPKVHLIRVPLSELA